MAQRRARLSGRVGTGIDVSRVSAAVQRPGIDPRVWLSEAVVVKVVNDAAAGIYVDVDLVPSETRITARLGHGAGGYGAYFPPMPDDTVLVAIPMGDPDAGAIIIGAPWSEADPPPPDAIAHPADVSITPRSTTNLRLNASDTGKVILAAGELEVARRTDPTTDGKLSSAVYSLPPPAPPGTTMLAVFYTLQNGLQATRSVLFTLTIPPGLGFIPLTSGDPQNIPSAVELLSTNVPLAGIISGGSAKVVA